MTSKTVDQLLDETIRAYQGGDIQKASQLLAKAIQLDADNERAWLWLSGVVNTDAERLFCIKRIIAINPLSEIAQYALEILPPGLEPVQPSFEKLNSSAQVCTFPGCEHPVSKPGFKFCYKHWKAVNAPLEPAATLNATSLGEKLGLSNRRMNLLLSELGWINRDRKGWVITPQGAALGAIQKEHPQTGVPFALWPESLLLNKALMATVKELRGETGTPSAKGTKSESSFREKFTPTCRATDGHWVRSKAEMLIDNWLYMSGIVHAYERRLPIEEEMYCDFYIPEGKIYLEFWGLEKDPKYVARKKAKLELYQKYNLNLIEITDEQVKNLDDFLPKMLLKYDVVVS